MAYTPHGHHIQGTKQEQNLPAVRRACGGTVACTECSDYARSYLEVQRVHQENDRRVTIPNPEPTVEKIRGVFVVYGVDNQAYPIAMFENEELLVQYLIEQGVNYHYILFWPFNTEWDVAYNRAKSIPTA